MTQSDLNTILPTVILIVWACLLLLVDLFIPRGRKGWTALLAALGLAVALGLTLAYAGREQAAAFFAIIIILNHNVISSSGVWDKTYARICVYSCDDIIIFSY